MAIPERYVTLEEGKPVLMRFDDYYVATKEIHDKLSDRTKKVSTYQLHVINLNGRPVDMEWSVLSWKLIQRIEPFIETGQYKTRTFKVTKHGKGFHTKYELEVL